MNIDCVCVCDDNIFGPKVGPKVAELERKYGNIEVYPSKSGKLTSYLINKWYQGTLKAAVERIRSNRMTETNDEAAVLILADSSSGHSKRDQVDDLRSMGVQILRIPPKTTDRLQPLDVNYNRQLKIFYNRIIEEAFYQDMMSNVTSREGILNIQSLIHNQFTSPLYNDMIRFAWRNTDASFNRSELSNYPPRMVNSIQFDFDDTAKCSANGCEKHAFVRCAHCGKLYCLNHFLERSCVHTVQESSPRRRPRDAEICPSNNGATCAPEDDPDTEPTDAPEIPLT